MPSYSVINKWFICQQVYSAGKLIRKTNKAKPFMTIRTTNFKLGNENVTD